MTSSSIFSLERETGQQDLSRFKYSPSTNGNFSPHPCNYPQLLILWPGLLILLTKQLHHRESVGLYSSWACLDPLVSHLCQRDWGFMLLPGGRRVILNVVGCYPWVVLSLLPILLLPSYFTRNNTVLSPDAKSQTFQGVIRDTVIDKYRGPYNPSPNRNTSMTAYNRT